MRVFKAKEGMSVCSKSAGVLVVAPIFFVLTAISMSMSGGNPLYFVIYMIIIEGIANLFYTAQKINCTRGDYLEYSATNKWIKLAHLPADFTVVCFHIYFYSQGDPIMFFYPIMELLYLIMRLLTQFSTALTLAKITDTAVSVDRIKFRTYPLHLLMHLIPIVDVFSAFIVDRRLNKIKLLKTDHEISAY